MVPEGQSGRHRQGSNEEAARATVTWDLGLGSMGKGGGAEPSLAQAHPVCLRTMVTSPPLLHRLSLVLELGWWVSCSQGPGQGARAGTGTVE